jgi:polyketide synthase PksL
LEEYLQDEVEVKANISRPLAFLVSARSLQQLDESVNTLRNFIQENILKDSELPSLAYVLQCGRQHHDYRFATTAKNREELIKKLNIFLDDKKDEGVDSKSVFCTGHVVAGEEKDENPSGEQISLPDLIDNWVNGTKVNWFAKWEELPSVIESPLYPFAKERHWIPDTNNINNEDLVFINQNKKETKENEVNFIIKGDEYFLRDHQIGGSPILPAAAYFNYFINIAKQFNYQGQLEFNNVTWVAPLRPESNKPLTMVCHAKSNDDGLAMEFTTPDDTKTYCRTKCKVLSKKINIPSQSLEEVKKYCSEIINIKSCYPLFSSLSMVYGPSFQCMESGWINKDKDEALIEVSLKASQKDDFIKIEPGMMDSIFQSAFVFLLESGENLSHKFIPYNIKSIEIQGELTEHVFVHVRRRHDQKENFITFDFTVYDDNGISVIDIIEFNFRTVPLEEEKDRQVHLYETYWHEEPLLSRHLNLIPKANIVLFDSIKERYERLCDEIPGFAKAAWLVMPGEAFEIRSGNVIQLDLDNKEHLDLLFEMFLEQGGLPNQLIFNLTESIVKNQFRWERLSGLDQVRSIIELYRAFCGIASTPRFHSQIIFKKNKVNTGAVSGFLRALNKEFPTISANTIEAPEDVLNEELIEILKKEIISSDKSGVKEIRWESNKRYLKRIRYVEQPKLLSRYIPLSKEVIVITGGTGAIGKTLAKTLCSDNSVRIALIGRSTKTKEIRNTLFELRSEGATVEYWHADCADREKMETVINSIRKRFGPITGILHSAGVLKDSFFVKQEDHEWQTVLKSKVFGAYCLDELTKEDPLRWFVVCSGLAGIVGNIGQSNYGLANAWLNSFSENRQDQVNSKQRSGQTMAIVWPLWQTEKGMQAPESVVKQLEAKGLSLIKQEDGASIFMDALNHPRPVTIPFKGKLQAINEFLGVEDKVEAISENITKTSDVEDIAPYVEIDSIEDTVIEYLTEKLSAVTNTPKEKIDSDVSLDVFGLDSILIMELNAVLEKQFPEISKTLLFEARSIRALAKVLIDEYSEDVNKLSNNNSKPAKEDKSKISIPTVDNSLLDNDDTKLNKKSSNGLNIAIIGLAGQYPGSSTPKELWNHLVAGDDLVTEIPGRWSENHSSSDINNDMYARWGGFLDDFDKFDPLFFGISPRDAERMDPQERLFLQSCWHALEDAGYTPETLSGSRLDSENRRRVAVIVGVMYGEYQFYGASAGTRKPDILTNSSYASIANRVSYCLDFDGPSFAIDSMCSSSLTSIHLACDQLRSGSCDAVLAGGVNLSVHPYKYRTLSELKFASTDGKCRSFGEGGDGYVPGEGVGTVLLKRLEDAERDNDHIYAVIQGSDLGHGARTSGYTVPNADAQTDVIKRAFKRSHISPSRLSYIEAHGTGTSLGDPIEVRGLSKALAKEFSEKQQCPIGSIKSNVGHLESAAGMAALTKVLYQLKHDKLVPSIHSDTLNKNIDFSKTPFYVQKELSSWHRTDELPRVTAVSSFGAGGSNAHLVVEEYISKKINVNEACDSQLFLFSSRSHQQLTSWIKEFVLFLGEEVIYSNESSTEVLGRESYTTKDVAMTLMNGRKSLPVRLAVQADSFKELIEKLNQYLSICENDDPINKHSELRLLDLFYMDTSKDESEVIKNSEDIQMSIGESGRDWLIGVSEHVKDISSNNWRKVPLPGYVFLRNRYWVKEEFNEVNSGTEITLPFIEKSSSQKISMPLKPETIIDLVSRGEMDEVEARKLLLELRDSQTKNSQSEHESNYEFA